MKAYHVFSWEGEYDQYQEDDHKYFLNEQKARDYKKELDVEHEKLRNKYRRDGVYRGGAVFEEIEIEN